MPIPELVKTGEGHEMKCSECGRVVISLNDLMLAKDEVTYFAVIDTRWKSHLNFDNCSTMRML